MRWLVFFFLLTKPALGFMFMEGDKLVSESEAIAVVDITSTGLMPDHWDFTLEPRPVMSPVSFSTGTVVSCLKGTLPKSLTVFEWLSPRKWILFFGRKNSELVVIYSLQVLDGERVEWYGKEWKSDSQPSETDRNALEHPMKVAHRSEDGRSFSTVATVCEEIREKVKADGLNEKK